MATPQWVLVQRRLEPREKSTESLFERNARKRQKQAVRSAIKKGILRILDQKLILKTAQIKSLSVVETEHIDYLSLPSSSIQTIDELAILSCPQLSIVNLPYNYLTDISAFHSCINLIKLDVSGNQIEVLPESDFWVSLKALKVLYLNGNLITNKECLLKLSSCPQLQILTLHDTPVSLLSNYRHITVNCIMSLKALDHHVISDEEIIENLHLSGKFRALARPFHRLLYQPIDKDDTRVTELKRLYSLLLVVDSVLAHYSPVIIIQRWIRGWMVRKELANNPNPKLRALVQNRYKKGTEVHFILRKALSHSTPSLSSHGLPLIQETGHLPPPPPSSPNRQPTPLIFPENMKETIKPLTTTADLEKAIRDAKTVLKKEPVKKKKAPKKRVCFSRDLLQEKSTELSIRGEHQSIEFVNKGDEKQHLIQDGANELREAKKEIKIILSELRQVPEIDLDKIKPEITKDAHSFTRGHTTMSLSTLRALDKMYQYNRKANDLAAKTNIVAQIRHERDIRRERILEHQQMIKETVINWKMSEELRLEKERKKLETKRKQNHMKHVACLQAMTDAVHRRQDREKFASDFRQQHTMIENTINREKRKFEQKATSEAIKETVQLMKEATFEQHDIVRQFMEFREEKLRHDNLQAKNQLNAQMIQIASQQLMEAKQRVAKEKARKKAAKDTIIPPSDFPMRMESITSARLDLSDVLHSIPEATVVETGLLGPLLRACENPHEGYSPKHMKGATRESHWTWQRGSHVIQGTHPHFPQIENSTDKTPLTYNMFRPISYLHSMGTTPLNSLHTSISNTRAVTSPILEAPTTVTCYQLRSHSDKLLKATTS